MQTPQKRKTKWKWNMMEVGGQFCFTTDVPYCCWFYTWFVFLITKISHARFSSVRLWYSSIFWGYIDSSICISFKLLPQKTLLCSSDLFWSRTQLFVWRLLFSDWFNIKWLVVTGILILSLFHIRGGWTWHRTFRAPPSCWSLCRRVAITFGLEGRLWVF